MKAYKLLRVRNDGSLGSLFIGTKRRLPIGKWLWAMRNQHRKGYTYRPYWHALEYPYAPHLSMRGRAWYLVEIESYHTLRRPARYGGDWYLAERLKVLEKA